MNGRMVTLLGGGQPSLWDAGPSWSCANGRAIADDGRFACFSPDGKRILVSRTINKLDNTASGDIAVYLMNMDGSGIRRLTQFPPHGNTTGDCRGFG